MSACAARHRAPRSALHEVAFRVNGAARRVAGDRGAPARRCAARRARPDRHEDRLQRRRLRRLHRAARRRAGLRLPRRRSARSKGRSVTTVEGLAACGRQLDRAAARIPRARRGAMRDLHAGHADGGDRSAGAHAAPERSRGAATRSAACSAAAPATARSSRRCSRRQRRARSQLAEPARGRGRSARARRRSTASPRSPAPSATAPTAAPPGALWLRDHPLAACQGALHGGRPRAACAPGIRGSSTCITAADVPVNSFGIFPDVKDQPVLADGRVRFRGEAVLCLVGDERAVLAIGDDEMPISWTAETPQTGHRRRAREHRARRSTPPTRQRPDPRAGCEGRRRRRRWRGAPYVAAGEFTTSFVEHAYIEPEAGFAERLGRRAAIGSASSPAPRRPTWTATRSRACSESRATQVRHRPVGGRRRVRRQARHLDPAAARASRRGSSGGRCARSTRGPSRWPPPPSATRRGCARASPAIADGRLLAADFAATSTPAPMRRGATRSRTACRSTRSGPYFVPNVRALTRAVYTNGPIAGAFRGFGVPQSTIVHEALLDELAAKTGLDRLELRHRNAIRAGQATATGQVLRASAGLAAVPRRPAAALAGGALRQRQAFNRERWRAHGRRRGVGDRVHVVRHRQHGDREPVDHARRADAGGPGDVLQRRGRYRPGLEHDPGRRSSPTRSGCR